MFSALFDFALASTAPVAGPGRPARAQLCLPQPCLLWPRGPNAWSQAHGM